MSHLYELMVLVWDGGVLALGQDKLVVGRIHQLDDIGTLVVGGGGVGVLSGIVKPDHRLYVSRCLER